MDYFESMFSEYDEYNRSLEEAEREYYISFQFEIDNNENLKAFYDDDDQIIGF